MKPSTNLPERDPSKSAEAQGLFRKFNVQRTDGSDQPGGKHYGCEYFVLDVDHDPHAKAALQAYAAACAQSHPQLSADLIARHGAPSVPKNRSCRTCYHSDSDGFPDCLAGGATCYPQTSGFGTNWKALNP